jgi:hypothetical protein
MVFFALCGSWVLHYLKIGDPAFKIAGGVILFLVTWNMLNSKRQARKRRETTAPALAPALASTFAPDLGLNIADNAGDEAIPSQKSSKEVSSNGDQPDWISRVDDGDAGDRVDHGVDGNRRKDNGPAPQQFVLSGDSNHSGSAVRAICD